MIRSNSPVTIGSTTLTASRSLHDNRALLLNVSAGTTVTLPRATGSGARYKFVVKTASNANVISGGTAAGAYNSTFVGGYIQDDSGDTAPGGDTAAGNFGADLFAASSGNNTLSLTTAGGGGLVGDWFEFTDIATDLYLVEGVAQGVTDPTNRFSTV